MTKVLITEDYLTNIGNSIRKENQTTTKYKPSEMANAIETNNANVSTRISAETEILNTQTGKLSNILTALKGKASGGENSVETCTVRVAVDQYGQNSNNYTVMYIDVSDTGQLEFKTVTIKKATNLTNTNGVSADINVVKGSLMVAHSEGNAVCTAPGMEYYENVTKLLAIPISAGGTTYSTIICQIGQEDSGEAVFS